MGLHKFPSQEHQTKAGLAWLCQSQGPARTRPITSPKAPWCRIKASHWLPHPCPTTPTHLDHDPRGYLFGNHFESRCPYTALRLQEPTYICKQRWTNNPVNAQSHASPETVPSTTPCSPNPGPLTENPMTPIIRQKMPGALPLS